MNPNEMLSPVFIDEPIHVKPAPVRIRHFFVFSLISSVFLCPATGLVALAYSLKSSAKADVNFHDKARMYSRYALIWNIISVVFAVVVFFVTIAVCYQMNTGMKMYHNPMHQQQQHDDIKKLIQSITNN
ncbi:unnamed protein product [Rotaria socialis]|uniref:Interferon-induced transmembrane protein n=1 Tax=Rotaria socialis TaxID=392032 RepID=A0A820T4U7_9BILA|nr:unnamed protein product [Rotaria socialis]CAF3428318.1 unnamed protein product [Rotaria socialis]CAF3431935.1 unnamed protein product [Rotaria socialis]CAF3500616.1 unnamed protein product [Rotaria socialis]CAF3783987.1 unnamed protein product [Rotaria socialis]